MLCKGLKSSLKIIHAKYYNKKCFRLLMYGKESGRQCRFSCARKAKIMLQVKFHCKINNEPVSAFPVSDMPFYKHLLESGSNKQIAHLPFIKTI